MTKITDKDNLVTVETLNGEKYKVLKLNERRNCHFFIPALIFYFEKTSNGVRMLIVSALFCGCILTESSNP